MAVEWPVSRLPLPFPLNRRLERSQAHQHHQMPWENDFLRACAPGPRFAQDGGNSDNGNSNPEAPSPPQSLAHRCPRLLHDGGEGQRETRENNACSVSSTRLNTHLISICTQNKDWKEPPECQLLLSLASTHTDLVSSSHNVQ